MLREMSRLVPPAIRPLLRPLRPYVERMLRETPPLAPLSARKTFPPLLAADLNRVNDAQFALFDEIREQQGGDAYMNERFAAYFRRWKEVLVYARDGDALLDIGGGNLSDEIFDHITATRGIDYHLADINADVVSSARDKLARAGRPVDNAQLTDNTRLPFAESEFAYVFSSHCLEHSIDMAATFAEIRRVLRRDGLLFFAVPFGFDDSEEHNYFFGPHEWIEIVARAGFECLNIEMSTLYPMAGWEYVILARKLEAGTDLAALTALAARFCKGGRTLVRPGDRMFKPGSNVTVDAHGATLFGLGAKCVIGPEGRLASLLLNHYPRGGVVGVFDGKTHRIVDCQTNVPHIAALDLADATGPITVTVLAETSRAPGPQASIYGVLLAE